MVGSGVQRVTFWAYYADDWHEIGADASAPYSYQWSIPSSIPQQTVWISSHVFDQAGNETIDPGGYRWLTNIPPGTDVTAPGGNITYPTNGVVITNHVIKLAADAWDNEGGSGVLKVTFMAHYANEWHQVGEDYSAPYRYLWNIPASIPEQTVWISTHVFDKAGHETMDPGGYRGFTNQPLVLDTVLPSGTITFPTNEVVIYNRTIELAADAWDNEGGSGIQAVTFHAYYGGGWKMLGWDHTAPYRYRWNIPTSVPEGSVLIGIDVSDLAGNILSFDHNEYGTFINRPSNLKNSVFFPIICQP